MKEYHPPLLEVSELKLLAGSPGIVLVHAGNGSRSRALYEEKHLEGARFADLNTLLSAPVEDASKGGRHPLPGLDVFSQALSGLGIVPGSHVIIYDEHGGANAAARFWWMLRAVGHPGVQVLNGGLQQAEVEGYPLSSAPEPFDPAGPYPVPDTWLLPLANLEAVEMAAQNPDCLVADVREEARYAGRTEPIDLVAGHIPGAVNVPYSGNLDRDGRFLSPDQLRKKYEAIFEGRSAENIIFHCGSGVTACHSLLAIASAGMEIPRLYVGSWSEWSRTGKPIATSVTG